jgi:hypothetical protein
MFSGKLVKKNGKLTYATPQDKLAYDIFISKLEEGQIVEMYVDLANADHSKAQLAKVHACIRELAKESGYTFDEMKDAVKEAILEGEIPNEYQAAYDFVMVKAKQMGLIGPN